LAFRAYFEGIGAKCDREPDFEELFTILGDRKQQEAIRLEHPGRHCEILKKYPVACRECPFSPYNGPQKELIEASEVYGGLIEQSILLHDCQELGVGQSQEEMMPEEFMMLRIAHRELDQAKLNVQAKHMAANMAEIIGKMFSGSGQS
jgi:hypothetical protein